MFLKLSLANLARDRARTFLAIVAIVVATFAFLLLRTAVAAWDTQVTSQNTLVFTHRRLSFLMKIPIRSMKDFRAVPGVAASMPLLFYGGRIVGRESEDFASVATEPESLFEVYGSRVDLPAADKEAWIRERTGMILGAQLAEQLHLKRGDKVSMTSGFVGIDTPTEFVVVGIYQSTRDDSGAFVRYDYVNESLPDNSKNGITVVISRPAPGADVGEVARAIDERFADTETPTRSADEAAFAKAALSFLTTVLGAIKIINGALLVLIGLIVGNAIAMSVRERTSEYGTLRALGFSPFSIGVMIAGEACFICLIGGALGSLLAFGVINMVLGPAIVAGAQGLVTNFRVDTASFGLAIGASAVLGIIAAMPPALRALRIRTVDALRSIG